jgi:hypothetical protein
VRDVIYLRGLGSLGSLGLGGLDNLGELGCLWFDCLRSLGDLSAIPCSGDVQDMLK